MIPATPNAAGYYWVRMRKDKHVWTVAFWTKTEWRRINPADILEVHSGIEGPPTI